MQFSSYLYYDQKAFGDSTWFKNFNPIRYKLVEISHENNTKDFCEVFLKFLSKNNGKWKNEKVLLEVCINQTTGFLDLSISGIDNEEIPEELKFRMKKYNSTQNLTLSNYPFNASCDEFQPTIYKDGNKLKLSYLKPNSSHSIGYEVHIALLMLSTDQLEMEFNNTSKSYCILPF